MRRLELTLSYFLEKTRALQLGSFIMLDILVFLNVVMISFFFIATKLYLFGGLILFYFLVMTTILFYKMRKIEKNAERIKKSILDRGYLK